jgi:hypothetical protein
MLAPTVSGVLVRIFSLEQSQLVRPLLSNSVTFAAKLRQCFREGPESLVAARPSGWASRSLIATRANDGEPGDG